MNRFFSVLQKLIRMGTENELQMHKGGEQQLSMPVLLFLLLVCIGFWIIVPLMVIGLFCGCTFRFCGPQVERDSLNRGMAKATQTAEVLKQDVVRAFSDAQK